MLDIEPCERNRRVMLGQRDPAILAYRPCVYLCLAHHTRVYHRTNVLGLADQTRVCSPRADLLYTAVINVHIMA